MPNLYLTIQKTLEDYYGKRTVDLDEVTDAFAEHLGDILAFYYDGKPTDDEVNMVVVMTKSLIRRKLKEYV